MTKPNKGFHGHYERLSILNDFFYFLFLFSEEMKSCKNKRREMKTANMVMTSMHKQKRPKSLAKTWSNSFLKSEPKYTKNENIWYCCTSDTNEAAPDQVLPVSIQMAFRSTSEGQIKENFKGDPDAIPSVVCVPICTYISREWHLVFQGSWEVHDIVHMRNRDERVSWCRHETLQVQASAMSFNNLKIKSGLIYFNLR